MAHSGRCQLYQPPGGPGRLAIEWIIPEPISQVVGDATRSTWLVETARKFNLQNKLGFVVRLGRRMAESHSDNARSNELGKLEEMLKESRLAKEGFFYRPPMTEREREWLSKNRTVDAAHWNLLADMRPEQLSYAR